MEQMMHTPNLGTCCQCGCDGPSVTNILMLHLRSPQPGLGCWGCLECDLPMAGAIAVICRDCVPGLQASGAYPKFACLGVPALNARVPIAELKEPFHHDPARHEGELAVMPLGIPGLSSRVQDLIPPEFIETIDAAIDEFLREVNMNQPTVQKQLQEMKRHAENRKARHARN